MIELTLELPTASLVIVVAVSTGRRAASKTNKVNTMARKVSMIGGTLGRRNFPNWTNAGAGSWSLTMEAEGLRYKYHLRSQSGSNGPIAKEESPLLGWRPILVLGLPPDKIRRCAK